MTEEYGEATLNWESLCRALGKKIPPEKVIDIGVMKHGGMDFLIITYEKQKEAMKK